MAKTQKMPRDPNAPRRNVSAYLLYQNAMRDTFKAQFPTLTFGELSKHTSAMYARLSPEEKNAWQVRAEADKDRYLRELAAYIPSPGYDASGNFILRAQVQNKKKERDPGAPKRNLSAYLLYQNAMRDDFRRDNPGMSFGQLSKYTSHMYKSLSFEEKSTWEFRAQQDKIRYEEEMKTYIPPEGYDATGTLLIEYKIARKNNRKAQKDPNAPKRARGSYVLFTQDYRPKVLLEYPGIKFTDLGTVLGQKWRALPPEERKRYDELAQDDKMRFAAEMEVYKSQQEQESPQHHQPPPDIYHYQPHPVPPPFAPMGVDSNNGNEIDQNHLQYQHNMNHHVHYQENMSSESVAVGHIQETELQQYNEDIVPPLNAHGNETSGAFPKVENDHQVSQTETEHMRHHQMVKGEEHGQYENSTKYDNLSNVQEVEHGLHGMHELQHSDEQHFNVESIESSLDAHLPNIELRDSGEGAQEQDDR